MISDAERLARIGKLLWARGMAITAHGQEAA